MSDMKLRGWMARGKRPVKFRLKMPDGTERIVPLPSGKRVQWDELVATVEASGAESIEKLGYNDVVMSGKRLADLDDDAENFEAEKGDASAGLSKAMKEQAAMLDAYGRRLNEAFSRGSDAASASQDKLVALVETLATHLTVQMTNVHNLSQNYAEAVALAARNGSGDEGNPDTAKLLQGVIGMAMGAGAAPRADNPVGAPFGGSNGKKGR